MKGRCRSTCVQARREAGQEGRCVTSSLLANTRLQPKGELMQTTRARGQSNSCSGPLQPWYLRFSVCNVHK